MAIKAVRQRFVELGWSRKSVNARVERVRRIFKWAVAEELVSPLVYQALSAVADHPITVVAAGRTDAGVHACAQVAHFETRAERPVRGWVLGANSHLPPDIAINWAMEVEPSFHARYTAQGRSYRYCMLRRATRPAILRFANDGFMFLSRFIRETYFTPNLTFMSPDVPVVTLFVLFLCFG